ncbi:CDP-archaeol synthase [Candidatus Sumerlaeota bacterium]|nr:CDP-archaeol synthase [Candidatus Sumerlaeales bacterium]NLD62033.1 CDP-archaeol synthase [Candidatus Sumerlaeota bacterium]
MPFSRLFTGFSQSRYRIGILGASVFLICIGLPVLHPLVIVAAMFFSAWGVHELIRLADARKYDPSHLVAIPFSILLTWLGSCDHVVFIHALPITLAALVVMSFVTHMSVYGANGSLSSVPLTVFATLYLGLSFGLGVHIVCYYTIIALMVILGTWATDTGAFLVGCRCGKHKMAPTMSPKKSWEGLFGGVITCMLACVVFRLVANRYATDGFPLDLVSTLSLGFLISIASVIGDLGESILKRDANIKDSGKLFGGHGGLLDRTDSLLFAFMVTYLFLSVTKHIPY